MSSIKYVVRVIKPVSRFANLYLGNDNPPKVLAQKEFDTKNEAKKYVRECMKKFSLIRHGYNIVSSDCLTELETNF